MRNRAYKVKRGIDLSIQSVSMVLFGLMCASVGLQVFNRLILTEIGMNFIWTASLGQFLMIITTFIGAGLASRDREHVRINYVLKDCQSQ
ncbi:TRAP transporter small permease subunit [Natrialba swarupiae]|nr:TRAP transporter small permease subunit [Natrialba swarupiae]